MILTASREKGIHLKSYTYQVLKQCRTLIFLARLAYLRVLRVSSKLHAAGERAASMAVSEFPPRLS